MLSAVRPKVSVGKGNRKFYTIHHGDGKQQIFTIQNRNVCSIIAFRNKSDCMHFGKLLENHYELTKEWPQINFDDTIIFRHARTNKLKYLDTQEWTEFMLKMFCIKNAFSMIDVHSFDDNKMRGSLLQWDIANEELYRHKLAELWEL